MPDPERGSRSNAIREFLKTNSTAGTQEIISALHNQGVEVSESLVHKIKYRSANRKKRAKSRKRVGASAAASTSSKVSMSEAIRAYLRQNPHAAQKEVKAALKQQGLKASSGLIGSVKFHLKRNRSRPSLRAAARSRRARKASPRGLAVTIDQLLEVKRLADSLGGAARLRRALETLEHFQ